MGHRFGSREAPGGFQGTAQRRLSGSFQNHVRTASTSPCTAARVENFGLSLHEHLLLHGRELDHRPVIVGIPQRGEDLSGHAKVRVVHVGALLSFGEAQSQAAKVVAGHGCPSWLEDAIKLAASHSSGAWYSRTSAASRLSRSAAPLRRSRSRASRAALARSRRYLRSTRSMNAEREYFDPARRSTSFKTSFESVTEVFSFIPLSYYHREAAASRQAAERKRP